MRTALISLGLALTPAVACQAADIHVLSAAAMQTVLARVAPDFERSSGHRLLIGYATMGAVNERVLKGETPDVVIGSAASMARLIADGKIDAQSARSIAKVGVGIVVPEGDRKPEVRSVEDFKRALLEAKTIVYADPAGGGAAGIHVAKVLEKLGLAAQLKAKTRYGAGGDVTEVTLAQGAGALGMTQISEIVDKPGAVFVAALPAELQNYTGVTAGVPASAPQSQAVATFLEFLKSPTVAAALKARGMNPD
jgi:molybdate transport system substrate-binding protein